MTRSSLAAPLFAASVLLSGPALALDGVVASIKPVHSLVAAVMGDTGSPELLVQGASSPHTYSLRPSEARKLEQAKVVFWVGEGMETFLGKPLDALARNARVITLSETEGLTLLDLREGGAFEAHNHDDHADDHDDEDHDDHDHDHDHDHEHEHAHEGQDRPHGKDMHIWLDPENARVMARKIAATLGEADPENAAVYARNAQALDERLASLMETVRNELAPVADKPFIVFHDAYHYFEDRFGLHAAGSISINPETPPSAQRVKEIRDRIAESGAICVFAEPQFEPKIVGIVTEGTDAKSGVLDPLGADLADGPDLYPRLIQALAASFRACAAAN